MKKLLNTILLTILLPLAAGAHYVEVGGIDYNLDDDAKTAEVTSTSTRYSCDIVIPNSVNVNGVDYVVTSIGKYAFFRNSGLTSVTIPSSVTSIGGGAFCECSGLTSVMLHEGLTSIGNDAFYECSGLTSVTIPSSVTSIGSSAFNGCSGLTSLTLHEGLTSIGDWAFEFCRSLTSLTIPSSVTSIGNCAFRYCSSLTSLTILEGVTSIGNDAFGNCSSLTSLTILEGVTSIGSSAFNGCSSLTSLTIPSSVTSIGDGAFEDCRSLTSLTLHEGLTSIGNDAFCECSGLTSLTIPSSVTSIGKYAFYYCRSLTSLTIPSSVTSIGESAFSYCSGLTSLTILEGVTSIGEYAFMECRGLTSVTIPSSVTSIGDCAFYVSLSLTSVIVGWENPLEIDGIVFEYSNYTNATLYVPKGAKVAYGVADVWKDFAQIVEQFDVSDGVVSDSQGLQYTANNDLSTCIVSGHDESYNSDLVIHSFFKERQVTSITAGAFSGCNDMMSLTVKIGKPLIIDSRAFENSNYRSIILRVPPGCKAAYDAADVWKDFGEIVEWFDSTDGEVADDQGVKYTANDDESTCYVSKHKGTYSTIITIPEVFGGRRVTSIGDGAFWFCEDLTSMTIPLSVTSIGDGAFEFCRSLTSLAIPEGVTSIGEYAFRECSGLTSVTIPSSVTSWGKNAFCECSGLTSLTLHEGLTSIGNSSFAMCSGLTSIIIPKSVKSIGAYAFAGCSGLTSLRIPSSVTSIGSSAFWNCSGLTSVIVENKTPISIDRTTFNNLVNATLYVPYGCKAAYEVAPYWKDFKEIVEMPIPATGVTLSLSAVTLTEGQQTILTAKVSPADAMPTLTWTSSNEKVATVSQIGEVYAVAPGSATVTVTTDNGFSAECLVTVEPKRVPTLFLTATPDGGAVDKGTKVTLSVKDDLDEVVTDAEVFYTLDGSEPSVKSMRYNQPITLTEAVTLKAVAMKEDYVQGELTATYSINKIAANGVMLSASDLTLTEGDDAKLVATVSPMDADTELTWSSNDESVATVNQNGEVHAVAPGTATITVSTDNGLSATCKVTVEPKRVPTLLMAATPEGGAVDKGTAVTLSVKDDLDEDVTDAEIYYTLDGSEPSAKSTRYDQPIVLTEAVTLKALAMKDGYVQGELSTTYSINKVAATGVTLSASELTLTEGDDAKLVATVSPADADTELTWLSDDESVATVDGEGTVVGVSVGTATIMVTTDNGFLATCKVTVTERQQEHGEKQLVVVANLQAGEVAKGTEITLAVQDEDGETVDGADIYYTTDGRTPTQKSTRYEGVVTVNESMTLKAVAYKDGYTHSDVLRLAYIVIDDDSDLQWEDDESGVVYAFNTGDPMAKVQRVRSTAQGHVDIRENITVEGKTYTVTEIPKRAFAGASNVTSVTVPSTVTTVGESAFANDGLLALIWQSAIEVPADALPEEGNRSKNFLLYVNRAGQAPYGMGNIVVKTADGYEMSEALTLTDGDDFHCPVAFRAANVSYTHSYTMTTGLGSSEGWETLALPFEVETIRHSDGRTLVPFASWRSDSGNVPFWLYTLSTDGFVKAGRIQANTPYILSMPNNDAYLSEYNVGGEVTFTASNATILPSAALATASTADRTFVPTFRKIRSSSSVATLNSVNRLHSNTGGEAPGSRFISNLRLASPFEAVFEGSADAVRSFGLQFSADGVNAIDEVPATRHAGSPRIYNLQGQRVSTMRKGNLYIMGGKKAMAK